MFQTPFSDRIRNEAGIATMAVGNIYEPDHVNSHPDGRPRRSVLPGAAAPRRSLLDAACGRPLGDAATTWPKPYLAGRDQLYRLAARADAGTERGDERSCRSRAGTRWSPAAARGIGAAIARALAGAGARGHASAAGARAAPLEATAARLPNAPRIAADVTRRGRCGFHDAKPRAAAHGPVDIVIANAGRGGQRAVRQRTDLAHWQRMLDVNLTGTFLTAQAALAGMLRRARAQRGGSSTSPPPPG